MFLSLTLALPLSALVAAIALTLLLLALAVAVVAVVVVVAVVAEIQVVPAAGPGVTAPPLKQSPPQLIVRLGVAVVVTVVVTVAAPFVNQPFSGAPSVAPDRSSSLVFDDKTSNYQLT